MLDHTGCVSPKRDAADVRVIASVRDGTGRIIDSPNDVGGWPELHAAPAPLDSDGDGLPDALEQAHHLNPQDPADDGQAITPFSKENPVPVKADSTHQRLAWKGADDLSTLSGKPVRLRFHLTSGQLYAFWVSPNQNGASNGYVAAGGPGFNGPKDATGGLAN